MTWTTGPIFLPAAGDALTLLLAIVAMLAAVLVGNRLSSLGLMAALMLGSLALFAAWSAGGGL